MRDSDPVKVSIYFAGVPKPFVTTINRYTYDHFFEADQVEVSGCWLGLTDQKQILINTRNVVFLSVDSSPEVSDRQTSKMMVL